MLNVHIAQIQTQIPMAALGILVQYRQCERAITDNETDKNKAANEISERISVQCEPSFNSMQAILISLSVCPGLGLGLRQCKHTIIV